MNQTPEFMNPSAAIEAHAAFTEGDKALAELRAGKRSVIPAPVDPNAPRMFLSPTYPNAKFLVKAGNVEWAQMQTAALGMRPAISRVGDIRVTFSSGVCSVQPNEPDADEKIAWLEAHAGDPDRHRAFHESRGNDPRACTVHFGLCREQSEDIDAWYKMKLAQLPLASRPIGLDPDIDVDRLFNAAPQRSGTDHVARGVEKVMEAEVNAARDRANGQRN